MRSRWQQLPVLLALPFLLSGCVLGLGCELVGSFIQAQMPAVDVCGAFTGDCCGDDDGDGFPDECSSIFGSLACGRFDTSGCFCTVGGSGEGQTLLPEPAAYALPPNAFFDIRLPVAGFSSSHHAFFDLTIDDLQTYQAVVTYPPAFGFKGFLALGPPQTQIGAYGVDFDLDFEADLNLPLRALTADTAYVDADGSAGRRRAEAREDRRSDPHHQSDRPRARRYRQRGRALPPLPADGRELSAGSYHSPNRGGSL